MFLRFSRFSLGNLRSTSSIKSIVFISLLEPESKVKKTPKKKKNLTCETPKVMEHGEAQIGVNVGFKQPHSSSYLGVINFENF